MTDTTRSAGPGNAGETGARAFVPDQTTRSVGGERAPPISGYVWYVVALLTLMNVLNYADRIALSILIPSIKADMHLTDTQIGLLVGFAFSAFYAVCGLPIARWADRGSRKFILSLSLAVWSIATALGGATQNFWQLFAARVGVGAAEAGSVPCGQSIVCDYVPPARRASVFAVLTVGYQFGMFVGIFVASLLLARIGWRWTFVALGAPGLAVALIAYLTLREPVRGQLDTIPDPLRTGSSLRAALGYLAKSRIYRLTVLFSTSGAFIQFGFNQWLPSFYQRSFHVGVSEVGLYLALAIGGGSAIGVLGGGYLAHRIGKAGLARPMKVALAALLPASLMALAALVTPSLPLSLSLVGTMFALFGLSFPLAVAALQEAALPNNRATAASVGVFLTAILGQGLGPLAVGFLSDCLAPSFGVASLRYALLLPVALFPIPAMTLWLLSRSLADRASALRQLA